MKWCNHVSKLLQSNKKILVYFSNVCQIKTISYQSSSASSILQQSFFARKQLRIRITPAQAAIHYFSNKNHEREKGRNFKKFIQVFSAVGVGSAIYLWNSLIAEAKEKSSEEFQFGERISKLPEYSAEEIQKHDVIENRIWISYKHGVYDITDFVNKHPGGKSILLGAGASVEPFWSLYAVHKKPHVLKLLEKYRIGNLREDDVEPSGDANDPFFNEPKRHVLLKPSSQKPFNAEPPVHLLAENLITPNELFYVRNHLPVPEVKADEYELEVGGVGVRDVTVDLNTLKNQFKKHTVTTAIQCGGNRRSEMNTVKTVKGLNWGQAAISNAKWSGARLCDVLKAAGIDNKCKAKHVQFEGLDLDVTGNPYGASIPFYKAMDPNGGVILAYEMNGEQLPRDHGFPVRLVASGVVGARSVKWLGRIIVSEEESQSHWQQNDYKGFGPNIDWDTVDFKKSPAIQETPVTSAICQPTPGQEVRVKDGFIHVKGYAYSGGGRKIIRVDVSADGGDTWQQAEKLISDPSDTPQAWGWTIWKTKLAVPEAVLKNKSKEIEIVCKAVDSGYNTQPESFKNIWNLSARKEEQLVEVVSDKVFKEASARLKNGMKNKDFIEIELAQSMVDVAKNNRTQERNKHQEVAKLENKLKNKKLTYKRLF